MFDKHFEKSLPSRSSDPTTPIILTITEICALVNELTRKKYISLRQNEIALLALIELR